MCRFCERSRDIIYYEVRCLCVLVLSVVLSDFCLPTAKLDHADCSKAKPSEARPVCHFIKTFKFILLKLLLENRGSVQ